MTDDQQGIVSAVFAALALKACSVLPAHTVKLIFVSDEETHSFFGIKYMLAARPDLIIWVPVVLGQIYGLSRLLKRST